MRERHCQCFASGVYIGWSWVHLDMTSNFGADLKYKMANIANCAIWLANVQRSQCVKCNMLRITLTKYVQEATEPMVHSGKI
jgi:hypothetical protein